MTKKAPGTRTGAPRPFDTAEQTLAAYDAALNAAAQHGITPTQAVAATRDRLLTIIVEEAQVDAEIGALVTHMDGTADAALALLNNDDATPEQRRDAAARVIAGATPTTQKQLQRMRNQNHWRKAREAHTAWRQLGDQFIVSVLRPWAHAVIDELTNPEHGLADNVVAGGWQALTEAEAFRLEYNVTAEDVHIWDTQAPRYRHHYSRLRAVQLVAELEHIVTVTDELRQRGILPNLDPEETETTTAELYFERADLRPDPTTAGTRTTLWMAQALLAGAKPTIRTAAEAVKAHTPEVAMTSA